MNIDASLIEAAQIVIDDTRASYPELSAEQALEHAWDTIVMTQADAETPTGVAYTLVLVGLFWNGAGAVTLALLGEVKWSWLPALLAGSLLGGYLGAHWAIVKGNRWIKRAFEIVTVLVGLKLVL